MASLSLIVLGGEFSIHRLDAGKAIPCAVLQSDIFWIGKTDEELSLVCGSDVPVVGSRVDAGWSCLKVSGPLDLGLSGVLAGLAAALASAGISIFAVSTYDTDYILVKSRDLPRAVETLADSGYVFAVKPGNPAG
jgi:hypothetical protein